MPPIEFERIYQALFVITQAIENGEWQGLSSKVENILYHNNK